MIVFPSGLYCFTIWHAVPKYPSQMSVFPSLGTFTREVLPQHAVARQEKEELGTLRGMEDEHHLHPLSLFSSFFFFFTHPPRTREFFVDLCFQLQIVLCDSAPTMLCKNCACWRAPTLLGSLVPGSVQKPTKEWLCLRSFNLKKANGRIMEERKTETHSMIYSRSHWETDAA